MAIGFLRLDSDYISEEHQANPDGLWYDEPQNSFVLFQFDPTDVKIKLPSKWKDAKDGKINLQLGMDYESDTTENQESFKLTLHFSDYLPHAGTAAKDQREKATRVREAPPESPSTQRSLEILEAMALPLEDVMQKDVRSTYFTEGVVLPRDSASDYASKSLKAWDDATPTQWKQMGADDWQARRTDVVVLKRVDTKGKQLEKHWHPPRPLFLHLVTPVPFNCVLQDLEIEILALDNVTGVVRAANAKVTLVQYIPGLFEDGYNGLLQGNADNLGNPEGGASKVSLEDWNLRISKGTAINSLPPRREILTLAYKMTADRSISADAAANAKADRGFNKFLEQRRRKLGLSD